MKLTPAQHEPFERAGYLVFPGHFMTDETRTLTDAVPALYSRREAYSAREKGKDAVRTNFAAHLYSEPFARLAGHPRMVGPLQEMLGEPLCMHQFKINRNPVDLPWKDGVPKSALDTSPDMLTFAT